MTITSRLLAAAAMIGALGAAGLASAHEGRMGGFGPGGPRGPEGIDFAAIDGDGDGVVTRAELIARASGRIAVIDIDGDGMLDRAEIIAAMPARPGFVDLFGADPAEAMADRMLAELGATGPGEVAIAEVAEQRVNGLLTRLDTDRDDALSQAEAEAAMDRRAERGGPDGRPGRPRF